MAMLRAFLKNRSGVTSIEYGMIVVFLSLVVIAGIMRVQNEIRDLFSEPTNKLNQTLK